MSDYVLGFCQFKSTKSAARPGGQYSSIRTRRFPLTDSRWLGCESSTELVRAGTIEKHTGLGASITGIVGRRSDHQ